MTFDLDNWGKWASTSNTKSVIGYLYQTAVDNLATIGANGYFNELINQGILKVGDIIYVKGTDANAILEVTSVTTNIETFRYNGAAMVPVYGGEHTTVGGAALETITVTGALATDWVITSIHTRGVGGQTILESYAEVDKVQVEFSADPSIDNIVTYIVYRV